MIENLQELVQYRALLFSLITRDLKARYRGSVLGFLWTFLNPIILMLVYTMVFSVIMRAGLPHYSYFLFVGLLPWLWFSTSVLSGTSSISDRRDLITKVKFPPQVLPMTVIGSSFLNYMLTLPLLFGFAWLSGIQIGWPIVCFPLLLLMQFVFTAGIVYITASINVTFRDLQHLIGNFVTFLYFLTPVLYPADQIPERYRKLVWLLNPVAVLCGAYQDIFYYNRWPIFRRLGYLSVGIVLILLLGSIYMAHRRESFAESA